MELATQFSITHKTNWVTCLAFKKQNSNNPKKDKTSIYISIASLVVTTLFAFANFYFAYQTLKLNQHNAESADTERIQSQATQIATWSGEMIDEGKHSGKVPVILTNNSKLPIYNVLLVDINTKFDYGFQSIINQMKPPEKGGPNEQYYLFFDVVPPGQHKYYVTSGGNVMGGGKDAIDLLFTDTNNRFWFRRINGKLSQIDYLKRLDKEGFNQPYVYDVP